MAVALSPPLRLTDLGDTAFNVEFGDGIDRATNARVTALAAAIRHRPPAGLVEVVPTFRSLLVSYDPLATCRAVIEAEVMALAAGCDEAPAATGRSWRIPVCYDDDLGPDLAEIRRATGLSRAEVIALHAGTGYFVYMLGFMPGFAYLGDTPPALRLPRRDTPRVKVPAGSVAIADAMGAVYPWDSPGGWHLLGRTPAVMFDLGRDPPSLLAAGDRVAFVPVGRDEYEAACRDPGRMAPARLLVGDC